MQQLVSVIIPTFNRWKYLQEAIASVTAQTYSNWELIIVDDGSTDETIESVRILKDPRIHLVPLSHCGNMGATRNAGAAQSNGEWLSFLDSDDIYMPQKLELQLNSLYESGKMWGYGNIELMNENGLTIPFKSGKQVTMSGWITKEILTNQVSVGIDSLMVNRKLFEKLGGFNSCPDVKYREDYDLALRLSLNAEAVAINDLLARVREHNNRSTNAVLDGNQLSANVYGFFARTCPDKNFRKIAIRRQAHLTAEMAVNKLRQRRYWQSLLLLIVAIAKGDKMRHILSSIRRGLTHK